ncbi:sporulation related protein [Breznakibacter xylanolyticus]|uniref:Sporulation related protein n=1 Tax=Breznakibacter xylanolyticus TaxID=990 RepID=A0A2W7N397_9BACT|nr:SPOR domain-containing protein [Breznakibacter xylanolyticus]PZX14538.1 sporulation related protein [Breznakibacter xylanolyticus]
MKTLLLTLLLTIAITCGIQAQTAPDIFQRLSANTPSEGNVRLVQENGIADLVKLHIEQNQSSPGIDGYRIQLFSGSGASARKEAEDTKSRLMSAFPDTKAYLTYNAPFWRVRAGDYRNKSELLHTFQQMRKVFPNCYPVRDNTIRHTDLQQ